MHSDFSDGFLSILQKGMLKEIVLFQAKKTPKTQKQKRVPETAGFGEKKEAADAPGWLPGVTESGLQPGQPRGMATPPSPDQGPLPGRGWERGEAAHPGHPHKEPRGTPSCPWMRVRGAQRTAP